ncbi:hydrogen peroxide-inducible genes activator [Ostreibacterium oceani]|uniref:LysR family transcriptional regulator n=1 Tax=Ostreibacterium oceani TaxID=2654998 RepID=A0A6N7F377_9GAMM|nr:hydrogen peroxide-inducible genes activator [Ostreibacterium oceani]MPV86326.1 LysR family transcriptional regulator [Ostreibacterium oceani]
MTLTELRYIVALEQTQHFGRAAERVFVSQPTLSVGIKKLEAELGVQIFERLAHKAIPTQVGKQIIEAAKQTLMNADTIRAIAEATQGELVGNVHLGAIYTVCPYLLPKMIPALQQTAPEVKLFIKEAYTQQLIDDLKAGELDVALVSPPIPDASLFESLTLFSEPFYVLMPKGHALATKQAITAEALRGERVFLLGGGNCFRDQVLEACPGCEQPRLFDKNWVQGGSLETIRMMVSSGLGISVFPEMALVPDENIVVRPFAPPMPQRQITLIWRKSFIQPQLIKAIATSVVRCLGRSG